MTTFSTVLLSSSGHPPPPPHPTTSRRQYYYYYEITGVVANARLRPLLERTTTNNWVDITPAPFQRPCRKPTTQSDMVQTSSSIFSSSSSSSSQDTSPSVVVVAAEERTTTTTTTTKISSSSSHEDDTTTTIRRIIPDFLWENAPRHGTKTYRDYVKVYSHLPNGLTMLDSKWVLGQLFSASNNNNNNNTKRERALPRQQDDDTTNHNNRMDPLLSSATTCETHCFIGINGFEAFAKRMGLLDCRPLEEEEEENDTDAKNHNNNNKEDDDKMTETFEFCDIVHGHDTSLGSVLSLQIPSSSSKTARTKRPNLWVVKDAMANGAGGVWVVGQDNAATFVNTSTTTTTTPLYPEHKYVAQQYVWPLITYDHKKFHVRVYVTITCEGQAFIHRRAFLHVANEPFSLPNNSSSSNNSNKDGLTLFENTVHITNCCANSQDGDKFVGEILADLTTHTWTAKDGQRVVPLAMFFPSIRETVAAVTAKTFPYMDGGQRHCGFEYCGMDFILSYDHPQQHDGKLTTPLAYLLEINAPPSQDTATGLPYAENLHNEVLRDWMNYWVIPHVVHGTYSTTAATATTTSSNLGGWICVYEPPHMTNNVLETMSDADKEKMILPSKAAILNKIRWALFEKKKAKMDSFLNDDESLVSKPSSTMICNQNVINGTQPCAAINNDDADHNTMMSCTDETTTTKEISRFSRSQFPYFSSQHHQQPLIFFENAGGAQVPQSVIDHMSHSLQYRHRSIAGTKTKVAARETARVLFGASHPQTTVVLGANATTLLLSLAQQQYVKGGLLSATDEVVISTYNHKANFDPWMDAAHQVGATVKLWSPTLCQSTTLPTTSAKREGIPFHYQRSADLEELVTPNTRIVAIPHASNILGILWPIQSLSQLIKRQSNGRAHIVVDGVAAVPHVFANFDQLGGVDCYVISMHKMFGPHMGVLLLSQNRTANEIRMIRSSRTIRDDSSPGIIDSNESIKTMMENGTANIEGCSGIIGVGSYFKSLADPTGTLTTTTTLAGDNTLEKDTSPPFALSLSSQEVVLAYARIRKVEQELCHHLKMGLSRSPRVKWIHSIPSDKNAKYYHQSSLPIFAFVHQVLSSWEIVEFCAQNGIICRAGLFLNTEYLAQDFHIDPRRDGGVVRISLAHYNTVEEIDVLCNTLESMTGW